MEDSVKALQDAINRAQIVAIPGGFSAGDEPEGSGKFIATMFRNPRVKDAITSLLNERDGLMLGICNGFQALIKLGLVPYGEIRPLTAKDPTLTFNSIGRHVSQMVYTRVASTLSPWLAGCGDGRRLHRAGFPWRGTFRGRRADPSDIKGQRTDSNTVR